MKLIPNGGLNNGDRKQVHCFITAPARSVHMAFSLRSVKIHAISIIHEKQMQLSLCKSKPKEPSVQIQISMIVT